MAVMDEVQTGIVQSDTPDYWRKPFVISRFSLWLLSVVVLSFALRAFFVFWLPTQPVSDGWSYFASAQILADDGRYQIVAGHDDATFPPAYPLLLALFMKWTAYRLMAAKLVNCLLGAWSVLMVAKLGRRLFGDAVGVLAAVLLAVYPTYAMLPVLLLSENLFIPLLISLAVVVVHVVELPDSSKQMAGVILIGALIGLLALTRSVAYLLAPIAILAFIRPGRSIGGLVRIFTTILFVQHLVMLPWAIRNEITLGRFTFLTSSGGIDFFIGNNPDAPGYWYDATEDLNQVFPNLENLNMWERDSAAFQAGLNWAVQNPLDATYLYTVKLGNTLGDDTYFIAANMLVGTSGATAMLGPNPLQNNPYFVVAMSLAYWMLILMELSGVALCLRANHRQLFVFLAGTALYFPILSAVFLADARFHFPSVALLIPIGALAITKLAAVLFRYFNRAFSGRDGITGRRSTPGDSNI